jgi:hypothetical protein
MDVEEEDHRWIDLLNSYTIEVLIHDEDPPLINTLNMMDEHLLQEAIHSLIQTTIMTPTLHPLLNEYTINVLLVEEEANTTHEWTTEDTHPPGLVTSTKMTTLTNY